MRGIFIVSFTHFFAGSVLSAMFNVPLKIVFLGEHPVNTIFLIATIVNLPETVKVLLEK